VGRDRGYRGLGFRAAPTLRTTDEPSVRLGTSADEARGPGAEWLLVTDDDGRPVGWVEPARVQGSIDRDDLHRGGTVASIDGSSRAVLDAALSSPSGRGVIVDADGSLLGTVTAAEVVAALDEARRRAPVEEDRDG
jgi:osmoprotectant transport system ATP-binding protein